MTDFVIPEIKAAEDEMIAIRHYLHANPELSLEEFNTSELVAGKLTEWGYQVTRELGKNRAGRFIAQGRLAAHHRAARRYGRAADF
ncbi:Metal-dependent amidase/aminoacylase/carboxypeptidase [Raoultella terrigena]|uniref:Metal-dependent amidase/aminoacylase/carboxypeptidase n=1 Tax=Raoultella terrigena TaxID=577 RepID=A0A4U9DFB5_RAOTE|nr:Metal-dependent amidase/aminoacylase/carboxypeptidase [Raoultella terrigena]